MKKIYVYAMSFLFVFISHEFSFAACAKITLSGLPHSFEGVHRCGDKDEWAKEAQARCLQAAKEQYGNRPSFTLYASPQYSGNSSKWEDCTRHTPLGCVDWARRCRATFDSLTCYVEKCE